MRIADPGAIVRIAPANLERVLRRASRSLDFTDSSLVLAKSMTGKTPTGPWDHKGLDLKASTTSSKASARSVFVDANLESQQDGVVTYRLRPATMCGSSLSGTGRRPPTLVRRPSRR